MHNYGFYIDRCDPNRFDWLFRSILDEHPLDPDAAHSIVVEIADTYARFLKGEQELGPSVYRIGKWLSSHDQQLFEALSSFSSDSPRPSHLEKFVTYVGVCNSKSRSSVDAWCIVARRLGVVKDIRRLIGEKVWADRENWKSSSSVEGSSTTNKRLKT